MAKSIMPNWPSGFDANKSRETRVFISRKLPQIHRIKTSFTGVMEENSACQVVIHPKFKRN
jgi:hypothetical protein